MSPPDEAVDLSMLEFFCAELTEAAASVQAGLTALLDGPAPAAEAPAALVRAAGSIKAAARIAGLSETADLARAMEEVFETARGTGRLPGRNADEALLAATAVFVRLSRREPQDIPQAVLAEADGMADLTAVLSQAAREPSATTPPGRAGTAMPPAATPKPVAAHPPPVNQA
ncbi:MAG: Hpt domain-containing protein, partial [Desulfovibrionaceae bacterium]|nr:Hpt domain-containing protein [Desulfovibrionaceae bacterium]